MPDATERRVVSWLALAMTVATVLILWPFATWIVLAVWASALMRPAH